MPTFNVLEAKSNLSRLLEAIESGRESEIIIARNGRPVARLAPLKSKPEGKRLGVAEGRFEVPENIDRDNALIERMFGGGTA
jgi:antitoxin (DNA-binding transcriptional repressor) of toxin-antitoxin stability system